MTTLKIQRVCLLETQWTLNCAQHFHNKGAQNMTEDAWTHTHCHKPVQSLLTWYTLRPFCPHHPGWTVLSPGIKTTHTQTNKTRKCGSRLRHLKRHISPSRPIGYIFGQLQWDKSVVLLWDYRGDAVRIRCSLLLSEKRLRIRASSEANSAKTSVSLGPRLHELSATVLANNNQTTSHKCSHFLAHD